MIIIPAGILEHSAGTFLHWSFHGLGQPQDAYQKCLFGLASSEPSGATPAAAGPSATSDHSPNVSSNYREICWRYSDVIILGGAKCLQKKKN